MEKNLIVLTPLPQFRLMSKAIGRGRLRIGDTMLIQPLRPRLRRAMLEVAKAEGPTDDLLMLLNESELVFIAQVPGRSSKGSLRNKIDALVYSPIASEILNRVHDCFLLFAWVPASLLIACWFSAEASAKYRTITEISLLSPGWKYAHQFTNVDWRSPSVLPVDIDYQYFFVCGYWAGLRRLCQIDQLEKIFTDPDKRKGLFKSAQESAKGKVDEFVRDRWGPDTTVDWSRTMASGERPLRRQPIFTP